ncbi:MAG: hypothetical protein ACOCZ5_00215 [bacterium]
MSKNKLTSVASNILNKDSYLKALGNPIKDNELFNDGHSVIVIRDNPLYSFHTNDEDDTFQNIFGDGWIKGVSLEPLELNLDTNWIPIDSSNCPAISTINSFVDAIGPYSMMVGRQELGSYYTSRHLWTKPGYLKIQPKFRVIDYYGNNDPLQSVNFLKKYIVGVKDNNEIVESIKSLVEDTEKEVLKTGGNIYDSLKSRVSNMNDGSLKDTIEGMLSYGSNAAKTLFEEMSSIVDVNGSPPPVSIQIGQWFYLNDMVIENIDFDFSKELSVNASPLWVDISISMRSRYIMRDWTDVGVNTPFSRNNNFVDDVNVGGEDDLYGEDNTEVGQFTKLLRESYKNNPEVGNALVNAFTTLSMDKPRAAQEIVQLTMKGDRKGLEALSLYAVKIGASVDDFTSLKYSKL